MKAAKQAEGSAVANKKRALVLGGKTGLLGQALTNSLKAAGWELFQAGRADLDPLNTQALSAYIDEVAPSVIFNAIAWTNVELAEDEPDAAYELNRTLPAQLGRIVRQRDLYLVHYSTEFVFNGRKTTPYVEADPGDPLNVYGLSKLAGEQALTQHCPENCCIVRTSWLFGPGKKNFIETILNRCACSNELKVVHDQTGSPTYTPDLADASIRLAEHRVTGIVHVANVGEATWCEFASKAVRMSGLHTPVRAITSADYPQKAERPHYSVLSTSLYTKITGHHMRPWPQALRDYIFLAFPDEGSAT
jgi:dTDP-4-dehydrorhamnose reductase